MQGSLKAPICRTHCPLLTAGVSVMPKRSTSVAVLEHELSELRLLLERQTGVLLNTPTETLFSVVSRFLESRHMGSTNDLLERLRSSDSECECLAERLFE